MTATLLGQVFELFPDPVMVVNNEGVIHHANRAIHQLLAAQGSLIGSSLTDWVAEPAEKVRHYLRLCGRTPTPLPSSFTLPNQPQQVYLSRGLLLQPRNETTPALILLQWQPRPQANYHFTELTNQIEQLGRANFRREQEAKERHKIDQKLQQTQKFESLAILAGGVAHDFNNLLTGVLGYTDLSLQKMSPESAARPYVEKIRQASLRAADLAKQMLIYTGQGFIEPQTISLSTLVEEIVYLLKVSIADQISLHFDFAPNLHPIQADPTQIRQVVMNLITNASEAIGNQQGIITLRTYMIYADATYLAESFFDDELTEGWYVGLDISDTGSGMSPEVQSRIFDPFFSTKFTGRGLGLAAVQGIIRSHQGALRVYSEVNRGTTFRILLPATNQEIIPAIALPTDFVSRKGIVLVIDDNLDVQVVAQTFLEAQGFEVLLASDGRQGVALFEAHHQEIVVVLLDLTMPYMDGSVVFTELYRLDSAVPVILCSGYNEQDIRLRLIGKPVGGYLQKPFTRESLGTVIEATLNHKTTIHS